MMTCRRLCIALAFLLAAAGCGLDTEEQAEVIEDVQYDLLSTSTSTTSTTVPERPSFTVNFYWHTASNNGLRILQRLRDERPSPAQTLTELVVGPLPEDFEENPDLQTQLDPTMEPQLSQLDGSTYQIQIVWPAEEQLTTEMAAEFVCTATQFAEIDAVTIVNSEGVPFALSGAGAIPIVGAARPVDFGDCEEDPLPGEIEPEGGEGQDGDVQDGETTTTTS